MAKRLNPPTLDEVRAWPATVSIPEAAAALGYGMSWAYQLAAADEFPCRLIKLNDKGRVRVVTASLIELLDH